MKKLFAAADYTHGQTNAIIKKLIDQAGPEGPMKFIRGELSISEPRYKWYEQQGILYFSVTSDGTSGKEWITRLEKKGLSILRDGDTEKCLLSSHFKPTNGITTEVAILRQMCLENYERTIEGIHKLGASHNFEIPNIELACLIRDKFTVEDMEEMGLLRIIVMHKPIVLSISSIEKNIIIDRTPTSSMITRSLESNMDFTSRKYGFAFVVSQVTATEK